MNTEEQSKKDLIKSIQDDAVSRFKLIIRADNIDIKELVLYPIRNGFKINEDDAFHYVIAKNQTKFIDALLDLGISIHEDPKVFNLFLQYAVESNAKPAFMYLMDLLKSNYRPFFYSDDPNFMSPFYRAIHFDRLDFIHIMIARGAVNPNNPIRNRTYRVYPACLAVHYSNEKLIKYFAIIGVKMFSPVHKCYDGDVPEEFQNITFSQLALKVSTHNVKMLLNTIYTNRYKEELTLQRRIYISLVLNETNMDMIPNYIKNDNYEWLMSSQIKIPDVVKAQHKIRTFCETHHQLI